MRSLIFLMTCFSFCCFAESILITGTIESKKNQNVIMPMIPSFQGKISDMAEEGSLVQPGDFLLRVDGSSIDTQIDSQLEDLLVFKSTSEKELLNLDIELNQSQIAFARADTQLKIAKIDAQVPLNYIGELAYKQNQLQLKNAEKTFDKTKNTLNETKIKIENKKKEIEMGLQQKQGKLDYLNELLSRFTVHARQSGFVLYSNNWRGEKIQIGDQLNSGQEVLTVSQNSDLQISAWINAIDVPKLNPKQKVNIQFDSFLGSSYLGQIVSIASGGEDKEVWGDSLYYKADVEFIDEPPSHLMLGMSALIEAKLEGSSIE